MANSLNLHPSFYRNSQVQKESESQETKRLHNINNPSFVQTRFGRVTGALASMLSLNGGGALSAIRSVIPKCNSQFDGMKQFLENVEVTRTHGVDQLKLKDGARRQMIAYRKWGQFMPGHFGAKTYGDIIQKVNESLLVQHQGRHYALPRLSQAVERRVYAQGGFYEGKEEQKLSSLQTILRKVLLDDLSDAQKAKTISSGFLMIGAGAGIGAAVSLGLGALIGGLAGFGALMASAGGATAAYKHMEHVLTDQIKDLRYKGVNDEQEELELLSVISSTRDSSSVATVDQESHVQQDHQPLSTNSRNQGMNPDRITHAQKVDRLIPIMGCAHDLNMLLTHDIKGKGTQDLSVLRGHCIHLLETQSAKKAVDRALLRFLNGHDAFNSLRDLQELVSKEMQNNEENRIAPAHQHRVSTPEILYGSQYDDQRELILGRRSFVESLPKTEDDEVSSDHDLETASISSGSDTSEDSILLSEQNAKRQHFYSSVKASESGDAISQALNSKKRVIDSSVSLLTTIYESSTENLQSTFDSPQVSLENQNTTSDTQHSKESIVMFLKNNPIDCSYLLKYLEQFTHDYNLGSFDQFISPADKHQSIEQNNPELLSSPIRHMFEKIDQQSQVQSNKFKAELNVAFTASQLEVD